MAPSWTVDDQPGPWTKAREWLLRSSEIPNHQARLAKALQRVDEALDAEDVVVSKEGSVVRFPDHEVRLKASRMHYDLYNVVGPARIEVTGHVSSLVGMDEASMGYILDTVNAKLRSGSDKS